MSKGRRKVSRSNPVGKTTGERARSLRKLGWKDKEIAKMASQTKKSYLKYGIKPQPFSMKERILQTSLVRKPGPATKNKSIYSEGKLLLKASRFNEPATKDGKKNKNYIPVKEKDKDISDLRQKRAASKEGGPKLTKPETLYLEKLTRWNVGSGRAEQSKKESIFNPARRVVKGGIGRVRQEQAKKEERAMIDAERSEQFKEGVQSDTSKIKELGSGVLGGASRIERRQARQIPGGERAMKRLGIETEDIPKFGREFRKSRNIDRKEELTKQLEEKEQQEKEEAEKEPEKRKVKEENMPKVTAKAVRGRYTYKL